ncbi:hypothetical protein INT45_005231, partial [Circinella minor]
TVTDEHDPVMNQFLQNNTIMSSIKLDREPAPKYTTEQPSTSQELNKEDDIPAWICSKLQQAPLYGIPRVTGELCEKYIWSNKDLEENEFSLKKDPIRSMAYHPHRNMIAFADENDIVYVYEKKEKADGWSRKVLTHQFMRNITCIEWKKRARGTLAVGCQKGVCVWNIGHESSGADNVDSTSMNYLCSPGHENISSIGWDPTPGSHLLAVTSGTISTIMVYDTLSLSTMPLKRIGKGNLLLRWSPSGRWIYVATKSGTSRMWDTLDWTYKELNNPPGLWVQSACWAPNSRSLLISMHGKSDVHMIYWASSSNAAEICHEKVYSAVPAPDNVTGDDAYVGDSIKELVLCPDTGRRLAVIFDNSPTIALYAVDVDSPLTLKNKSALTKIGNIHNTLVNLPNLSTSLDSNRKPVHISLSTRFTTSNTLATLYDNDIVNFTPIIP